MNYESTLTTNDIESALIDWADAEGESEARPSCLSNAPKNAAKAALGFFLSATLRVSYMERNK